MAFQSSQVSRMLSRAELWVMECSQACGAYPKSWRINEHGDLILTEANGRNTRIKWTDWDEYAYDLAL